MQDYDVLMVAMPTVDILVEMNGTFPIEEGTSRLVQNTYPEPGGAGNILIACRRVGGSVLPVGPVGDDFYGRYLIGKYQEEGIETKGLCVTKQYATSQALCVIDERAHHSFISNFPDGIFRTACSVEEMINQSKSYCLSGYSLRNENGMLCMLAVECAEKMWKAGKPIFFDTGPFVKEMGQQLRNRMLEISRVVIVNSQEAKLLTGEEEPSRAAKKLRDHTDARIIVKKGADGCYTLDGTEEKWYRGFPVKTVNTMGAGDSFLGVFMYGYLRGFSKDTCVILANAAGAVKASKPGTGTKVPTFDEITELLESNGYRVPAENKKKKRFLNLDFQ